MHENNFWLGLKLNSSPLSDRPVARVPTGDRGGGPGADPNAESEGKLSLGMWLEVRCELKVEGGTIFAWVCADHGCGGDVVM